MAKLCTYILSFNEIDFFPTKSLLYILTFSENEIQNYSINIINFNPNVNVKVIFSTHFTEESTQITSKIVNKPQRNLLNSLNSLTFSQSKRNDHNI